MSEYEHESKDFMQILRAVRVLLTFEERDEDIGFPVIIDFIFGLVDFIDFDNAFWAEWS